MYIELKDRDGGYEPIVAILRNGIMMAIQKNDKSLITYVLERAFLLAWIELGGGYQYGSEVKSIIADVHDEFASRLSGALKNRRKKVGDITQALVIPEKKPKTNIVDKDGKPLKSEDK